MGDAELSEQRALRDDKLATTLSDAGRLSTGWSCASFGQMYVRAAKDRPLRRTPPQPAALRSTPGRTAIRLQAAPPVDTERVI